MADRPVLSEASLTLWGHCPLYRPATVDLMTRPAEQTFRWALTERHIGKIPTVVTLREHFVAAWAKGWNQPEKTLDYWEGPQAARTFARRVYEFLLKHEVVHPFEPYALELDAGRIRGMNTLVLQQRYRREPIQMVVDMKLRRPRDTRLPYPPFYPVLAQWLAARQESDALNLGISHIPLIWGERWSTLEVNEPLVRRWLDAIVREAAGGFPFPRVGPQCLTCLQPCKEAISGQDDHSWSRWNGSDDR